MEQRSSGCHDPPPRLSLPAHRACRSPRGGPVIAACYPDIWPLLVNWGAARTGCRATGEDLASAAIERCLRAEMRGQDTGRAYAFIALRCCWIDWHRTWSQRTSMPLGDLDPPDRLPDQLAGIE